MSRVKTVFATVLVVPCQHVFEPRVTHARLKHYPHAMEIDYGHYAVDSTKFRTLHWEVLPYRSNPELRDLRTNGRWNVEEVNLLFGALEESTLEAGTGA